MEGGFFLFFELRLKSAGGLFEKFIIRSIRSFSVLELESSISQNIRNFLGVDFFVFWGWG